MSNTADFDTRCRCAQCADYVTGCDHEESLVQWLGNPGNACTGASRLPQQSLLSVGHVFAAALTATVLTPRAQLCLCISTLVVRHLSWDTSSLLRQLSSVFESSDPSSQPTGPRFVSGGAVEWLGPLVELLALLPEECQNRKVDLAFVANRNGS